MRTTLLAPGPVVDGRRDRRWSRSDRWPSAAEIGAIGVGAGIAVATGRDGPAPWPAVRAVVVLLLAAGTVAALRRAGRRSAATVLVGFGLVGLVAGAGIGGPAVVKVGIGVESVGGSAALVAGLAVVVVGSVRLLRGTRWWWKLAPLPAAAAVGLGLVVPLTIAVTVTNAPPLRLGARTPAEVALVSEDVVLRTADGEHLMGWYVASSNGAAVVLLAGAGSTRDDELDHAAAIARHGYGVLLLDVRGHGGSTGEANLLGWYGEVDVVPAIDFLSARPDVHDGRIGAVGMSMGAQQAVAAAGVDARLRAVVAEGVVGRHSREVRASGPVDRAMGWTAMKASELITSAPSPRPLRDAVLTAAPNRVLVIAGGKEALERDFAEELREASPSTVEVWVASGAGHTAAFAAHPAEWEARVAGFLARALS